MTTLTITAKGQVTLRKELLKHLGLEHGRQIELSMLPGGRIEVRATRPAGHINGFIGLLEGNSPKRATIEELNQAVTGAWTGNR